MKIKRSKDIGEEYGRLLDEEESLSELDNYDFTPYNLFMNTEWILKKDLIDFVECNCGDIDFIYQLKNYLDEHSPSKLGQNKHKGGTSNGNKRSLEQKSKEKKSAIS